MIYFRRAFLVVCCALIGTGHSANYTQCRQKVIDLLTNSGNSTLDPNGTIITDEFPDPIYHGSIRGFNTKAATRPLTLTAAGCLDVCGSGAQLNNVIDAFSILTTWVLPVVALLTQLPYDSLSDKKRKNLEAFGNWIGAPAAALTTTIWNIHMIQKCRILTELPEEVHMQPLLRDSLYVLSCINQYQYPRHIGNQIVDERRDIALLRGVLAPYVKADDQILTPTLQKKVENLTVHLAFRLRLYRRKGVYPLWFNLIWFLLAFIFSIVTAFAQLGDNTTAHSLALGLLLSWMPILVLATIIDRNPVASTRCAVLIERWLYNIDALFAEESTIQSQSASVAQRSNIQPSPSPRSRTRSSSPSANGRDEEQIPFFPRVPDDLAPQQQIRRKPVNQYSLDSNIPASQGQWHQGIRTSNFTIGEYVGQGRRLRYCAVTDTVLDLIKDPKRPHLPLPDSKDARNFRERLTTRPKPWYVIWLASQFLVAVGFGTAFTVSFKTPTMGLGCRSLAYLIWYLMSLFSWVFLGIFQEPPRVVRYFAWLPNALSTMTLFSIMLLQVTGGLNSCVCKSSTFGSRAYGGYMDFENAQFYHQAYEVRTVWGMATGFGLGVCTPAIGLFWKRWSRDSSLWRVSEGTSINVADGVSLHWLT